MKQSKIKAKNNCILNINIKKITWLCTASTLLVC